MNFLILLDEINKTYNANNKIVFNICDELEKRGHRCYYISIDNYSEKKEIKEINGKSIIILPRNDYLSAIRYKKDILSHTNKYIYYILHPIHALKMAKYKKEDFIYSLHEIYSLIKDCEIDCIFFYYFPVFYTYEIISRIDTNCFKVLYQLDPLGFHELLPEQNRNERINKEMTMFEIADLIITTPILHEVYKNNSLYSRFLKKTISLGFPNISSKNTYQEHNSHHNNDKYNLFFIGTIDDKYRNPKVFLDFIHEIITNYNMSINLYFIGTNNSKVLNDYSKKNSYIHLLDSINQKQSQLIIDSTGNYLININNSLRYQSPSKIVDYISSGNPIINVVKNKNDYTVELLESYPLAFNIFEYENNDVNSFVMFLKNAKNKKVDSSEIKKNYYTLTSDYFVSQLMEQVYLNKNQ